MFNPGLLASRVMGGKTQCSEFDDGIVVCSNLQGLYEVCSATAPFREHRQVTFSCEIEAEAKHYAHHLFGC